MNSSSGFGSGSGHPPEVSDGWEATRAQTALATQIMQREDELPTLDKPDIGEPSEANQRELFVSCAPDLAMQQQFEHLHPEFIAVHDIATTSTRRLLAGLAAATGRAVQKLVIRRQGYGTPLASLDFVELPTPDGSSLRLYSAEADTAARQGLARVLLGFSKLAVMIVGDLPAHSIESALKPFQQAMITGPWPNRQLLLLPLSSGSALAAQGAVLALSTNVVVRTSPQVTRPADAWGFINGTWSRMKDEESPGAPRSSYLPPPRPSAEPRPMRPMPPVRPAATRETTPHNLLERYVHQLSELQGMVSCCVFDVNSGLEVAHAGASPGAADLAMHGKALLAGMSASSRTLGLGHTLPEAAITLGSHHLLLRAVPGHPGLALHAALDKTQANLTLIRLQVARMDALFDAQPSR
ncbi:MAG TPA: hypothetical protein VGM74_05315 [Burkholderiaceae bacterium]